MLPNGKHPLYDFVSSVDLVQRLCRLCKRLYRYERTAVSFFAEYNFAINKGKERVVSSHPYVFTGVVYCASLTYQYVAGLCKLAAENLHAKAFAGRFTTVLRTTYTFLMCHFLTDLQG